MLNTILKYGSAIGGGIGNALDLPGSSVRDVLALKNPFDQYLDPFGDSNRTSGRGLLRQYGLAGNKDTWGNFAGGLAAETALDPLNVFSGKAIFKAMKDRSRSLGIRNRVINRNVANQAHNLGVDIGRNRLQEVARNTAEQAHYHNPLPLPANHSVNVAELPEGWRGMSGVPHAEQMRAAYGPVDDAAQVIGKYVTGGDVIPTTNPFAKAMTRNAPYKTFEFQRPPSSSKSLIASSSTHGFIHKKRPDILFHRGDEAIDGVMNAISHETVHSMAAADPALYSHLKGSIGDEGLRQIADIVPKSYGFAGLPHHNPKLAEEAIATSIGQAIGKDALQGKIPLARILHRGDPTGSRLADLAVGIQKTISAEKPVEVGKALVDYMSGASKKAKGLIVAGPRKIIDKSPRSFSVAEKAIDPGLSYKRIRAVPELKFKPFTKYPGLAPVPVKEIAKVLNRNRTTRSRSREE